MIFISFDPLKQQLIGERTSKVFKIGQKIEVQISRVDLEDKKLDLIIDGQSAFVNKTVKHKKNRRKKRNG